jgi:hypothetical protein
MLLLNHAETFILRVLTCIKLKRNILLNERKNIWNAKKKKISNPATAAMNPARARAFAANASPIT